MFSQEYGRVYPSFASRGGATPNFASFATGEAAADTVGDEGHRHLPDCGSLALA